MFSDLFVQEADINRLDSILVSGAGCAPSQKFSCVSEDESSWIIYLQYSAVHFGPFVCASKIFARFRFIFGLVEELDPWTKFAAFFGRTWQWGKVNKMESDLDEVRQDISKVLQMINDKAPLSVLRVKSCCVRCVHSCVHSETHYVYFVDWAIEKCSVHSWPIARYGMVLGLTIGSCRVLEFNSFPLPAILPWSSMIFNSLW